MTSVDFSHFFESDPDPDGLFNNFLISSRSSNLNSIKSSVVTIVVGIIHCVLIIPPQVIAFKAAGLG